MTWSMVRIRFCVTVGPGASAARATEELPSHSRPARSGAAQTAQRSCLWYFMVLSFRYVVDEPDQPCVFGTGTSAADVRPNRCLIDCPNQRGPWITIRRVVCNPCARPGK